MLLTNKNFYDRIKIESACVDVPLKTEQKTTNPPV